MIKGLMMLGALGYMATIAHGHPATTATRAGAGDPRPAVVDTATPSPSISSAVAAILDGGRSVYNFLTIEKKGGASLVQASTPTACNLISSTGDSWSDYYRDEKRSSAEEPAAEAGSLAALPSPLQS